MCTMCGWAESDNVNLIVKVDRRLGLACLIHGESIKKKQVICIWKWKYMCLALLSCLISPTF